MQDSIGELPHAAQAIDLAGEVSGWGVREGKPIHPCAGVAETSYRTARAVPLPITGGHERQRLAGTCGRTARAADASM